MKIINTQAGQAYDLEPGTQIEMERTNLFFNEWGEQSVPMELPDTDRNRALCGYPDLAANVKRPSAVKVRAQDLDGNLFEFDAEGLLAVCVQHELDHLDGKVFIDHLSRMKKERARMKLLKIRRKREHEREEEA